MRSESMPIIRLEVEHMKHAIISHIGAVGSDLGELLSEEITRALETYDWQGQVTAIVHEALTERIADHFNYGEGRKAVIDAVSEGFEAVVRKATKSE